MKEYPIIRLELERMKHSMLTHLGVYHQEISDQVEKYMDGAIKNFDFGSAVEEASRDAIVETINGYFKYGDGNRFIREVITKSLNEMFKIGDSDEMG